MKTKAGTPRACADCKSSLKVSTRVGCYSGGRFRGWLLKERAGKEALCETNNYLVEFRGCGWEGK